MNFFPDVGTAPALTQICKRIGKGWILGMLSLRRIVEDKGRAADYTRPSIFPVHGGECNKGSDVVFQSQSKLIFGAGATQSSLLVTYRRKHFSSPEGVSTDVSLIVRWRLHNRNCFETQLAVTNIYSSRSREIRAHYPRLLELQQTSIRYRSPLVLKFHDL